MKCLSVFLFFTQCFFAQTYFQGKVDTDVIPSSVLIVNNNSKELIRPTTDGSFVIKAELNDLIVFASEKIEGLTIKITSKELNEFTTVYLKRKSILLEEVEVKNYPNINAVSLGIISKDVKTYTKAERKLLAIQSNISPMGLLSRAFSDEVKMLKKEIENEKNEKYRNQILNHFTEEFFRITLGIPIENITGFLIFVLDDINVHNLLEIKNFNAIELLLKEKTFLYLERLNGR